MPKKEVREDTYALVLAAKLYALFIGAFVIALGSDLYHAAQSVSQLYAGAL
ncbi:MAG: hypothetical protein ACEQSB_02365 [Undibacterium sp.]